MHPWLFKISQEKSSVRIKPTKKLPASVMMYSIFVLVIILIILSALFLYSYINRTTISSYHIRERLRQNAESGINILLGDSSYSYEQTYYTNLFNENMDSISLKKEKWGLFDLISANAWYKNFTHERKAISGGFYKQTDTKAVYLVDKGSPLCICGNTMIKGNCALPRAGVKRGYIEGRHFSGSKLIDGDVSYSSEIVPFPGDNELKSIMEQLSISIADDNVEFINSSDINEDSIYRSFFEKTLIVYEYDDMHLNNLALIGNIIIVSEKSILIGSETSFKGIVAFAKNIYVLPGTKGNMQCLAKDTLWVGENCNLSYPSTLSILPDTLEKSEKLLKISKDAFIEGVVADFAITTVPDLTLQVINIEKKAIVKGQVYSANSIVFKGILYGQICLGEFRLQTPSSIYVNHLLDAEIDLGKLPDNYTGFNFQNTCKPKKIIQWLH